MTDEPLHVQTARALGNNPRMGSPDELFPVARTPQWVMAGPFSAVVIPRYDTDWSATGPLIEKYGIAVSQCHPEHTRWPGGSWIALWDTGYRDGGITENGPTPLIAVCRLLLKLAEAGKLAA